MIPFAELDTKKIKNRLIILDIDGTLTIDGHDKLEEGILEKIEQLKIQNNTIQLCSNRSDHYRNREIAKFLGVKYLETDIRKPSPKILN